MALTDSSANERSKIKSHFSSPLVRHLSSTTLGCLCVDAETTWKFFECKKHWTIGRMFSCSPGFLDLNVQ